LITPVGSAVPSTIRALPAAMAKVNVSARNSTYASAVQPTPRHSKAPHAWVALGELLPP
jgi:hypothetical protein